MASKSLGTLTLDLIAKIGGFEQGMDKASRASSKTAAQIKKDMQAASDSMLALGLGIGAAGAAVAGFYAAVSKSAESIANFQGLSEKIGDTAVAISSLKLASDVSGVSLDTVGAASIRLTASLAKQDEESKGAAQAIKALGLQFEAFKSLSPVEQLDAVAKAMAGFKDGSEKTAVAVALFGKAGAELLPFLNDLANGSERQTKLTAEQIEAADRFTKSTARLSSELSSLVQIATGPLLVGMDGLIDRFKEAAKQGDGFFTTLLKQTEIARLLGINKVSDAYGEAGKEIRLINASLAKGTLTLEEQNLALERRAELVARQAGVLTGERMTGRNDPRSLGMPKLDTSGLKTEEKKPAAKQSEADRYLESLQKQLEKTKDLTVAEQVLIDITSGRLGKVNAAQKESLLLTARQIDAAKEIEKNIEMRRAAAAAEGDAVLKVNQAYQDRLKTLMDATPSAMLEKQRADVKLLTEEYERFIETFGQSGISQDQYLEAVAARLDLVADKTKEANDFARDLGLTFTSAFEDAIVSGKSLGEILQSLIADIAKIVIRKTLTEPIGSAITGALGGFFGGGAGSALGALGAGTGITGFGASFAGGGFTGDGGRSGGIDGLGGFPAILHPNETVVDHTKGQVVGGGKTFTYAPVIQIDGQLDQARTQAMIDRSLRGGFADFTNRMEVSG
jgi:hypothetical protein